MAQESNLGRNALAKALQLEGIKVSSGSISKILKEWKESRSKSNNGSIIDTTAATTEQTKSVDEITLSATSDGQSQPLLEFHRGFASASISKSIDTSGSPTFKCESSLNGVGLADVINQQSQQEIAPELEEIDFADEPFDSDVSTDSINNDIIENEVSTEESEQEECDLGINSDSKNWEKTLFKEIIADKIQRRQEIQELKRQEQRIEQKKYLITQMKNEIDLQRQDLERRRSMLADDEMLIPFAKSLRAYGATAEILLPFLSAVHEKALIRNIDLKTSAEQFIQELKSYRELVALQRNVELAKQQLMVDN